MNVYDIMSLTALQHVEAVIFKLKLVIHLLT